MPKYVIERDLPGAGSLSGDELTAISEKSCNVLRDLGPSIQWQHSYVYIVPDAAAIQEHARRGGFPTTRVSEVRHVIDPTTSERQAVC